MAQIPKAKNISEGIKSSETEPCTFMTVITNRRGKNKILTVLVHLCVCVGVYIHTYIHMGSHEGNQLSYIKCPSKKIMT